jgi:hypothetical protein
MQLHESVNPLIECVSLCRKILFKRIAVDPEQHPALPMQHRPRAFFHKGQNSLSPLSSCV